MKSNTSTVVYTAIIAALYAVLTLFLAPIAYGPIQFRASEILKAFAMFNPWTGVGIAIGDVISALGSPFVGPWDLIFMPITDLIGGLLIYRVFQSVIRVFPHRTGTAEWIVAILSMILYAVTTSASVALMLWAFGIDGYWILFWPILASELIILNAGIPIILQLRSYLVLRGSRFFDL